MDVFDRLRQGEEVDAKDLLPKPTPAAILEAGGEVDAAEILAPEEGVTD